MELLTDLEAQQLPAASRRRRVSWHLSCATGAGQAPCLTLRENTERPVTVKEGTNRIVGNDPGRIVREALAVLDGAGKAGRTPELWDGRAAERIVAGLRTGFQTGG